MSSSLQPVKLSSEITQNTLAFEDEVQTSPIAPHIKLETPLQNAQRLYPPTNETVFQYAKYSNIEALRPLAIPRKSGFWDFASKTQDRSADLIGSCFKTPICTLLSSAVVSSGVLTALPTATVATIIPLIPTVLGVSMLVAGLQLVSNFSAKPSARPSNLALASFAIPSGGLLGTYLGLAGALSGVPLLAVAAAGGMASFAGLKIIKDTFPIWSVLLAIISILAFLVFWRL